MKITNKLHRGTAITAGVVFLITMVISIISAATTLTNYVKYGMETSVILTQAVTMGLNIVILLLTAVMMLRGKKDTVAGVVFILISLYLLIRSVITGISQFIPFTRIHFYGTLVVIYLLMNLLAGLVNALFRILVSLECFKPGCLSGNGAKIMLIAAPILAMILSVFAYLPYSLQYAGTEIAQMLTMFLPMALSTIINGIAPILMGLSFSIPVKEAAPTWTVPESFQM